jgi:hypothetical protein
MGSVKHRYRDSKIALKSNKIADVETGEIFEIGDANLMKRINIGEIRINSKAYVYLDTDMLMYLIKQDIRQVDLALLVTLSSNLLTGCNICMQNDDDPHTTLTIAEMTGNKRQAVKTKLNRLIDLGLLHYGVLKEKKKLGKVYIVNPHFIRKGLKFRPSLAVIFQDIRQ